MKEMTGEWVEKAESDYRVALRESQATDPPEPDVVCFHSQQCVEKYVKAFLQEHGVEFERTHNMNYLHSKCVEIDKDFSTCEADFLRLDDYSVDIRNTGDSAAEEDARKAVAIVERLRAFIRAKLGLE